MLAALGHATAGANVSVARMYSRSAFRNRLYIDSCMVKGVSLGLHSSLVSVFLGRKISCIAGIVGQGGELKEELFPQVSLAVFEVEQVRR